MLAGEQHVAMPNCHLHMRPGHVYLRDWSQPFDAKTTPMLLNSVLVPRHLLEAQHDLDEDHPVVSWPISTPGGRVTSSLWSQLLFEFETAPVEEAERLCSGFLSFLSAMIATGKRETVNRSRADMEDYLNACLLEQVGVDDLCRQFQVSRTTVYRLFHSTGGVRQYIVNARLDHCHMELWSSDPSQVRVRDVARAWGFSEATSFARSFRARFGVPPSTVLGRGWTSKTDQRRARQDLSHIFQEAYAKWFNQAAGAPNTRSGASDR